MSLKKYLREQSYDLIDGPVRNHKLLQLWRKRLLDRIENYYEHIDHAFTSSHPLTEVTNNALNVNTTKKDDYSFNIGLTVLEDILKSIGLGNLSVTAEIKSGKKISISYDNAITKEIPVGEIENYLFNADFKHANPELLRSANRNTIIVISGVVLAKNLVVNIETSFQLNAEVIAKLNTIGDGKLDFSISNESTLKMVSHGTSFFPIAVKANRIDFDKGEFDRLSLVSNDLF